MVTSLRQLVTLGLIAGAVACSRKTPEPVPVAKAPIPPAAAAAAAAVASDKGGDGKLDPNDPKHGQRRLIGLDTPIYVDGAQVAVLRAGEMPVIPRIELEGGAYQFRLYDYLAAIGASPDTLKSVHIHGNGDKIGSVEGTELRAQKDRFVFSFTAGDSGVPLQKWDTEKLKNEYVIHEIRRITIYVKKPSPAIHAQKQCHTGADGDCSDAIPYSTGEVAKGTRVYLDGKMVGFVKRRQVGEALVMGNTPEGDNKYSVAKLIAQMGVDPTSVKSVELMAGDDVVGRASGESFQKLAPTTYFTLPKHNHGKVKIHVPAEIQASAPGVTNKDALVSSVLLYKNTTPIQRNLVTISEDTDLSVQLAAIDDARGRLGRGEQ